MLKRNAHALLVWLKFQSHFDKAPSGNVHISDPLEVDINPVDKKRLVGENVTFCCEITGDPAPKYYEWYVLIFHLGSRL